MEVVISNWNWVANIIAIYTLAAELNEIPVCKLVNKNKNNKKRSNIFSCSSLFNFLYKLNTALLFF